jgi:Protein of unknown function (DUF4197)
MINKISVLLLAALLTFTACDTLQQIATSAATQALSNDDIGFGLKEALELGIGKGSDVLSQRGGFMNSAYKILLPEEARKVTEQLKIIPGFSKVEDIVLEKINAGAEDAAARAKPIFVNAIKSMSFSDAMGILMGDKNSATAFLKRATYQQLTNEFTPIIVSSLDKFEARKYWGDAVKTYNQIPFVKALNPSLEQYVTEQALNGLFSMVEGKERDIRSNIGSRSTDLLRRVFAKQDAKQ